ncbi:MAG: aldehyde ferredoxin oxidoreductase C-terminal domain-containing protein [Desulfovibrio sp.]
MTKQNEKHSGWAGTILHVNCTTGEVRKEQPALSGYSRYIGGRGLALYLFEQYSDRNEYPVVFSCGPMAGTGVPGTSRFFMVYRNGSTGLLGGGNVGGDFGEKLKLAGYDALVLSGHSDTPVLLDLSTDQVELTPMEQNSFASADTLYAEYAQDECSVCMTGSSFFSRAVQGAMIVDGVYMGPVGSGLALAGVGVRGIRVHGNGTVAVKNPDGLNDAVADIKRLVDASPVLSGRQGIGAFGTGAFVDLTRTRHMTPTENFRKTYFDTGFEDESVLLNAPALNASLGTKSHTCGCGDGACKVACIKQSESSSQPLPDFHGLSHFTALVGNNSLDIAVTLNHLCYKLGLHPQAAASAIACWQEVRGKQFDGIIAGALLAGLSDSGATGIIPPDDLELLKKGTVEYARARGREEAAMCVKGLDMPAWDPRGAYGLALAMAVCPYGPVPEFSMSYGHEVLRKPVATDRFSFEGKARIIKLGEDVMAVADSLMVCPYYLLAIGLEELGKALQAVTGLPRTGQALMNTGAFICLTELRLNKNFGATGLMDELPDRFFLQAGTPAEDFDVPALNREDFLICLEHYRNIRCSEIHACTSEEL